MTWVQKTAPNLNTQDAPGMCLRFVTKAYFGDVGGFPTARAAWDASSAKHETREMPSVSVPVWFSWVGTIDGVTKDWGHVAIYSAERNEILSSPLRWTDDYGQSWVSSIEDIERILGASYLGWTHDLTPIDDVAYWVSDPTPAPEPSPEPPTPTPAGNVYIVQPGDTLSEIGDALGMNWVDLYEANRDIVGDNPNLIHPGQELRY